MTKEKAKAIIQQWTARANAYRNMETIYKNNGDLQLAEWAARVASVYEYCANDIDRAFGRLS